MTEVQSVSSPKIRFTTQIPESARGRGRPAGAENVIQNAMVNMPAPSPGKDPKGRPIKDAPIQYASFWVPAEVSDTITDPAEREKAAKDACAKLVNRFTSMSRRVRKGHGEDYDFTFRKSRDPDMPENGTWGVTVYRIEPGSIKRGPQRKAA